MTSTAIKLENSEPIKQKKIFALDDDETVLLLLERKLSSEFKVISFQNTSDIVIRAEVEQPEVILLDLNLPNIDGFEVLTLLKSHPATSVLPVICMSGDDSPTTRDRIRQMGAIGFIRKPFELRSLLGDIKGLLATLNHSIKSRNEKISFVISYNENEKSDLIHKLIYDKKNNPEQLILLHWRNGGDFLTKDEESLIESEKLIFLHIKSSLIVKFPYLQELSPITNEIFTFLKEEKDRDNYHLIFDEVRNILNIYEPERALAKSYSLITTFKHFFGHMTFFNTRPSNNKDLLFLQKLGKIFVQGDNH